MLGSCCGWGARHRSYGIHILSSHPATYWAICTWEHPDVALPLIRVTARERGFTHLLVAKEECHASGDILIALHPRGAGSQEVRTVKLISTSSVLFPAAAWPVSVVISVSRLVLQQGFEEHRQGPAPLPIGRRIS